ncbi:MAG: hypothetical protein Q7S66_05165 [bacterium]|nr:hypothetical protein [bacterium]
MPWPTCSDNKQNQGEEEIDCGGPCSSCALKHPEDMSVLWARFVQVRENTYDAVAEVRNSNIKLGAADFEYVFRFYDDQGVLVAERDSHSFVFPGETIHPVAVNVKTQRTLKRATFTVKNIKWLFTDKISPDVVVGDKQFKTDPLKKISSLTAALINRSLTDFQEVFLNALILDKTGNVIVVSNITEKDLLSGETRPVVFSWPISVSELAPFIIIEARVNAVAK